MMEIGGQTIPDGDRGRYYRVVKLRSDAVRQRTTIQVRSIEDVFVGDDLGELAVLEEVRSRWQRWWAVD